MCIATINITIDIYIFHFKNVNLYLYTIIHCCPDYMWRITQNSEMSEKL